MQNSSWPRFTMPLIVAFAVVTTAAIVMSLFSVTRVGAVSVLPVTSQQTGITVCGHGKADATPDQAQISVGVTATAHSAQDARAQAARAMSSVIKALKNNGVRDQDIQTSYVSISPQYSYPNGSQVQTGYTATNTVTVTIRSVDSTGKVVDAVTAAGSNDIVVNGITFSKGDPTQALAQAQQSAMDDAQRQAQAIASHAGVGLGTPISIAVGQCGQVAQPMPYFASDQSAAGTAITPIQPGQQQYAVEVQVVYAIR